MNSLSETNQVVSVADALVGVWRRKLLVLSCLLLGIAGGFAVLTLNKPTFTSEAQVIIENLSTPYEKASTLQDPRNEPVDSRIVQSQVSILKSDDLAQRVIDQLNLTTKPEFNSQLGKVSSLKSLLISLGFSDDPNLVTPAQLAVKRISTHLSVYPTTDSNVIGIKYQAADPQVAADIANALADSFVLSTREIAAGSTTRARDWLSQQIDELRGKVSRAESEIERYRSESGLFKGDRATLGTQQISELNSQITLAQAASSEAAARADEIKNMLNQKGTVDASSDVLSSLLIQNLREQQASASRKLSELSATYLPNHPKMIAARKELESINRNIRIEASKVVESLVSQAKVAAARAISLQASLDKLKSTQTDANQSDVKLKELERDAQASRTLLEQMLIKYADAQSRQDMSLQPGFARIIQKASPQPTNYFPKAGPIVMLSSIAGLGLGLGLAFLFAVMSGGSMPRRDTFQVPNEMPIAHPARAILEEESAIPALNLGWPSQAESGPKQSAEQSPPKPAPDKTLSVLAALPSPVSLSSTLSLVESTYNGKASILTEAATKIAAACLALREQQGLNAIALTSLGGRTMDASLATVALTRAMAAAKKKVVAVDLSGNGSAFETVFELQQGSGVSDLVAGEADFTKVIARDPHSQAHVMRYGLNSSTQTQALITEKFGSILKALSGIYDVVLVHAGEASTMTPNLIKDVKGTMLLAPQSRYRDAVAAAKILEAKGLQTSLFVRLEPMTNTGPIHAESA